VLTPKASVLENWKSGEEQALVDAPNAAIVPAGCGESDRNASAVHATATGGGAGGGGAGGAGDGGGSAWIGVGVLPATGWLEGLAVGRGAPVGG
jgi:hypothetical protein